MFNIRSNNKLSNDSYLCEYHKKAFLCNYSQYHKFCCNPLKLHGLKNQYKDIREVSVNDYKFYLDKFNVYIKPGEKLCYKCRKLLKSITNNMFQIYLTENEEKNNRDEAQQEESPPQESPPADESPTCTPKDLNLEFCNSIFAKANLSPIEVKSGRLNTKIHYGRQKLSEINNVLDQKLKKLLDIPEDISLTEKNEVLRKSVLFDSIITGLKEKYHVSNKNEKIQCLTVVSEMTYKELQYNFDASQRYIRQSKKLKKTSGVLAMPRPKTGKPISQEIRERVYNFYCDDLYSRVMPGKKDYIRLGKDTYIQKRLILSTLRELYAEYKREYPGDKIGYSKFCTLRPKHCILADENGTHSVCVCCIHQNFNLLLRATGTDKNYKDLISNIVCNLENKDCMYGICESCPSEEIMEENVKNLFSEESDDEDYEDEYEYKEWTSTDRAELITKKCCKSELIILIQEKIKNLLPHVYVSKQQSKYFKWKKNNLKSNEAVIVLDFSKNYKFIVQDDIQQRFYFQEAITIHPIVIYLKSGNEIININLCYMSEDLQHDVPMVKVFIDKVLTYLKENYPNIDDVEIFTDGCGSQYKNGEIFSYLPEFENKFEILIKWNFFATSHGKTSCDGIGGCIKRQAALESLRRPYTDQIIKIQELLSFCKEHIKDIICQIITVEEIENIRQNYKREGKTIPGTRSFHQFFSHKDGNIIKCKHASFDEKCALLFNLNGKVVKTFKPNDYVAFIFNGSWHLGKLVTNNEKELESTIEKLDFCSSTKSYSFSENVVTLSIPYPHVLCTIAFKKFKKKIKINCYELPNTQIEKIENHFKKYIEKNFI